MLTTIMGIILFRRSSKNIFDFTTKNQVGSLDKGIDRMNSIASVSIIADEDRLVEVGSKTTIYRLSQFKQTLTIVLKFNDTICLMLASRFIQN